eukprot:TRINITY_DN5030_c1_g1_i1.p1 TRINITY_DN5030_c1_g1~~TRINITY_DN5030_c1_g1_i1.p1  ORF type:complete len:328 (+),score=142.24 TRINITY_DN5030_c1_g1_i1:115-984(+)
MARRAENTTNIATLRELLQVLLRRDTPPPTSPQQQQQQQQPPQGRSCITVLDVYCHTWGPCGALRSTFRDLALEHVDTDRVWFDTVQVDATAVLSDLKDLKGGALPLPAHAAALDPELLCDALPERWRDKFEAQLGQARPLFLFYKDCRLRAEVAQVNTPIIRRTVLELLREDDLAARVITNEQLLQQWEAEVGREGATDWSTFLRAVYVWCTLHHEAPLNEAEQSALREALGVAPGQQVHAKKVQELVGSGSFFHKFTEVCPGYAERVAAQRRRSTQTGSAARAVQRP